MAPVGTVLQTGNVATPGAVVAEGDGKYMMIPPNTQFTPDAVWAMLSPQPKPPAKRIPTLHKPIRAPPFALNCADPLCKTYFQHA